MNKPLRIGIAGLGTVGCGVVDIFQRNNALLNMRAKRDLEITCVSSQNKERARPVDTSAYEWVDNALDMASRDDVDVIVELIGGEEGVAKTLIEAALKNGKHVVTANKALLAHHGFSLAQLAEKNKVQLMYEAAVAGGIPIIKSMREGFAGNKITAVYGILNGTCNYILTEMRETGRDFETVLSEAQEKGFAEADPSFDVDGIDAAHKLCILSALAFGVKPDYKKLPVTGIRHITASDITYAEDLGYRIKLLGITHCKNGEIIQSVEPCLVHEDSTMGAVEGVFNTVLVEGDAIDHGQSIGRGAGAGPTGSSVVADIIDIARGYNVPTFGVPCEALSDANWADSGKWESRFYMHLSVTDRAGVLADIAHVLKENNVSVEALAQLSHNPDNPVSITLTTHKVAQENITKAINAIAGLPAVLTEPTMLRIEEI
jgi:homoserine dehydrogenase